LAFLAWVIYFLPVIYDDEKALSCGISILVALMSSVLGRDWLLSFR